MELGGETGSGECMRFIVHGLAVVIVFDWRELCEDGGEGDAARSRARAGVRDGVRGDGGNDSCEVDVDGVRGAETTDPCDADDADEDAVSPP